MDYDCNECKHQNTDVCYECSVYNIDEYGGGCSCHLHPPCSFCTDNCFEEKEK